MQSKPKTADAYEGEQIELVMQTCRYISTVLGDFADEIVIVGGLVPSLIIDQSALPEGAAPHAGTIDLDIGLSLAIFDERIYQNISGRLRGLGFGPDENDKGNPTSQRWKIEKADGKITVDFLIPQTAEDDQKNRFKNLEKDFAALPTKGLMLAFKDFVEVTLDGLTLKGEVIENRKIRVCGPGAFIVLKAFALQNRGENKDAYDLFYTIRNFGRGSEEVVERFIALCPNKYCAEALETLRRNFRRVDSLGPKRAAEFILGEGAVDEDLQADIHAFLNTFISGCDRALSAEKS